MGHVRSFPRMPLGLSHALVFIFILATAFFLPHCSCRRQSFNRIRTAANQGGSNSNSPGGGVNLQNIDKVVRGAIDRISGCAWGLSFPEGSESPFLPDLHTNYQGLGLRFFSNRNGSTTQGKPEEVYRVRARYPLVRYFSYQSYDLHGQNVQPLLDMNIKPSSGKNPFSDPTVSDLMDVGTYEVYITKYGNEGYPNELAALSPGSHSTTGLVFLRLHVLDPQVDEDHDPDADWGAVEPPIVEILEQRTGRWSEVQECSEHMRESTQSVITAVDTAFQRELAQELHLVRNCSSPQFSQFNMNLNPNIRNSVLIRNFNTVYLYWCAPKPLLGDHFVVRVTGKMHKTPVGLFDAPRVADQSSYETRYVSFTSADGVPLYSAYQTLADYEFEEFYGGPEEWNRGYSMIAALDEETAKACDLYDPTRDLLLTWQKPPLGQPNNPVIVMREILSKPYLQQQQSPSPSCSSTNIRGGGSSNGTCTTSGGGPGMHLTQAPPQDILHDYYPRVELFNCDVVSGFSVRVY